MLRQKIFLTSKSNSARRSNALQAYKLWRVMDEMDQRLAEGFCLSRLAQVAQLSECHFNRIFKRAIGNVSLAALYSLANIRRKGFASRDRPQRYRHRVRDWLFKLMPVLTSLSRRGGSYAQRVSPHVGFGPLCRFCG